MGAAKTDSDENRPDERMSDVEKAELFGLKTQVPTIAPQLSLMELLFTVDLGSPLEGFEAILAPLLKRKKGRAKRRPDAS